MKTPIQMSVLVIFFLLLYLISFVVTLLGYFDHNQEKYDAISRIIRDDITMVGMLILVLKQFQQG